MLVGHANKRAQKHKCQTGIRSGGITAATSPELCPLPRKRGFRTDVNVWDMRTRQAGWA